MEANLVAQVAILAASLGILSKSFDSYWANCMTKV